MRAPRNLGLVSVYFAVIVLSLLMMRMTPESGEQQVVGNRPSEQMQLKALLKVSSSAKALPLYERVYLQDKTVVKGVYFYRGFLRALALERQDVGRRLALATEAVRTFPLDEGLRIYMLSLAAQEKDAEAIAIAVQLLPEGQRFPYPLLWVAAQPETPRTQRMLEDVMKEYSEPLLTWRGFSGLEYLPNSKPLVEFLKKSKKP